MGRNSGKDIDVSRRVIRDRDGVSHETEGLTVIGHVLYYGRPIMDFHLFDYHELWAFAGLDLVVNRLHFLPGATDPFDWYIETDIVDVQDAVWRIRDGYLAVCLYEGSRYRLEDADEFADGLACADISREDAVRVMTSLNRVLGMLEGNGLSGTALLRDLAHGLPQ